MMENNSKWGFGIIISVIVIGLFLILFGFNNNFKGEPKLVYNVYLDGQSIGSILSKDSFEDFINSKE